MKPLGHHAVSPEAQGETIHVLPAWVYRIDGTIYDTCQSETPLSAHFCRCLTQIILPLVGGMGTELRNQFQVHSGCIPAEQISSAFWEYTSRVDQQCILGVYQRSGSAAHPGCISAERVRSAFWVYISGGDQQCILGVYQRSRSAARSGWIPAEQVSSAFWVYTSRAGQQRVLGVYQWSRSAARSGCIPAEQISRSYEFN